MLHSAQQVACSRHQVRMQIKTVDLHLDEIHFGLGCGRRANFDVRFWVEWVGGGGGVGR